MVITEIPYYASPRLERIPVLVYTSGVIDIRLEQRGRYCD
jgi:hypothetical protein